MVSHGRFFFSLQKNQKKRHVTELGSEPLPSMALHLERIHTCENEERMGKDWNLHQG